MRQNTRTIVNIYSLTNQASYLLSPFKIRYTILVLVQTVITLSPLNVALPILFLEMSLDDNSDHCCMIKHVKKHFWSLDL